MAAKGSKGFDMQAHRGRELERCTFRDMLYKRGHCLLHVSGTYLLRLLIAAARGAPFTICVTCTEVLYYALSVTNVLLMCC